MLRTVLNKKWWISFTFKKKKKSNPIFYELAAVIWLEFLKALEHFACWGTRILAEIPPVPSLSTLYKLRMYFGTQIRRNSILNNHQRKSTRSKYLLSFSFSSLLTFILIHLILLLPIFFGCFVYLPIGPCPFW